MVRVALAATCLFTALIIWSAPWQTPARAAGPSPTGRSTDRAGSKSTAVKPAPQPDKFAREIQPLLSRYCIECHKGPEPKGDISLEHPKLMPLNDADRDFWETVRDNLQSSAMPPQTKPQPSAEERANLIRWIETTLLKRDCSGVIDPGRVTIRRLNRAEYNNTIRDLIGVPFQPADDFPSDDVGYGFDNIGDVLSVAPLLFEKYMAAAEKITRAAIVTPDVDSAPRKRVPGSELTQTTGGNRAGRTLTLSSNGDGATNYDLPRNGTYYIRIKAWGDQAGTEPAKMTLLVDDKEQRTFDVKATAEDPVVCEHKLQLTAGKHTFTARFINDFYNKDAPPKDRDRNLHIEHLEIQGPAGELPQQLPDSHKRLLSKRPQSASEWKRIAGGDLRKFVRRAFRRPARDDEVSRLVDLVAVAIDAGESYERGLQIAFQAVLVSPHFLFRIENDPEPNNPKAIHALTEYELATRLSYFLWSSMPDEELLNAAEKKVLRKTLDQQVQRMLRDPRSRALVDNFAGQWLQLRNLSNFVPDRTRFPQFDDELRQAMRAETELFFDAVLREDRSLFDLLDADFTFANERLARHYGLSGVTGATFQRVNVTGGQRGGLLGQASILALTSHPTRTSPTKRGKWILDTLMGAPPPPPPPGVPDLAEGNDKVAHGTLRQRLEQHRSNPACASCHERLDPLGFGLENYDATGAWREKEGDLPIDPSGTLPGGQSFRTAAELKGILKSRRAEFRRCLTEKLLTYALGRGLEGYDACTIEQITERVAERQDRLSRLVLEIVKSEPFQKRRGKGESGS